MSHFFGSGVLAQLLWMNVSHIKTTWHKLPRITNVDWTFLFIVQTFHGAFSVVGFSTSKNKTHRDLLRQAECARWIVVVLVVVVVATTIADDAADATENRSANVMHVCVFHLRLMMCHIYEVSDSGSLNDLQLLKLAMLHIASPNGRWIDIFKHVDGFKFALPTIN